MIAKRFFNQAVATTIVTLAALSSGCMLMHARDGGCMGGHGDGHAGTPSRATCPVCGTELKVDERTSRASLGGKLYYFAGEDHLREFIKDPGRFTPKPDEQPPSAGHEGHGGRP